MDGPHHTVHRQLHQGFHLLRCRLGSPTQNSNIAQRSWAFRPYVQEPPNELAVLKPAIADFIHPIQYRFYTTTATFTSFGH